jgi:hypothetical protein
VVRNFKELALTYRINTKRNSGTNYLLCSLPKALAERRVQKSCLIVENMLSADSKIMKISFQTTEDDVIVHRKKNM